MTIKITPKIIMRMSYHTYGIIVTGAILAIAPAVSNCPAYGVKPLNADENRSRMLAVLAGAISNSSEISFAIGPTAMIEIVLFVVATSTKLTSAAILVLHLLWISFP